MSKEQERINLKWVYLFWGLIYRLEHSFCATVTCIMTEVSHSNSFIIMEQGWKQRHRNTGPMFRTIPMSQIYHWTWLSKYWDKEGESIGGSRHSGTRLWEQSQVMLWTAAGVRDTPYPNQCIESRIWYIECCDIWCTQIQTWWIVKS